MANKVSFLKDASKKRVRNLGVDFSAGGPIIRSVQNARIQTVRDKLKHLKRLGLGSNHSAKIFRAGFKPAACYGAQVVGFSKTNRAKLRTCLHCAAFRKARTRSCTVDRCFLGEHDDPTFDALWLPISSWHCAVWDLLLPRQLLVRLFSGAWGCILKGKDTIRGPATACIEALVEIGWDASKINIWKSRVGDVFDPDPICPKNLKHAIFRISHSCYGITFPLTHRVDLARTVSLRVLLGLNLFAGFWVVKTPTLGAQSRRVSAEPFRLRASGLWHDSLLQVMILMVCALAVCRSPSSILCGCVHSRETFALNMAWIKKSLKRSALTPTWPYGTTVCFTTPPSTSPYPSLSSQSNGTFSLQMAHSSVSTGMGMDLVGGRNSWLRGGVDGLWLRRK